MNWVESIGKTPGMAFASVTQVAGWAIEAGVVAHDQVGAIGRTLFGHLQAIPGVSLDVASGMQKAIEEAMKECLARASKSIPKQADLQNNAEAMAEAAEKLRMLGEHLDGASTYLLSDKVLAKGHTVSKGFDGLALVAASLLAVIDRLSRRWFVSDENKVKLETLSVRLREINLAALDLKDGLNELVTHRPQIAETLQKAAVESQRAAEELTKLSGSVRRFAASYPVQ